MILEFKPKIKTGDNMIINEYKKYNRPWFYTAMDIGMYLFAASAIFFTMWLFIEEMLR